jgi:hypothetical protein
MKRNDPSDFNNPANQAKRLREAQEREASRKRHQGFLEGLRGKPPRPKETGDPIPPHTRTKWTEGSTLANATAGSRRPALLAIAIVVIAVAILFVRFVT